MNYKKIYNKLCNRGQIREVIENEYYERHHIIPKCMGGTDDETNITTLTAREHFIAHLLLLRIYPNEDGIVYSAWVMTNKKIPGTKRTYNVSSRQYERLKNEWSIRISECRKGTTHTDETKRKISEASSNRWRTKRQEIIKSMTGVSKPPRTQEHLENLSKALMGISRGEMPQEHKNKISKSLKGYEKTNEHLENISKANTGKTHTEETKQKLREVNMGKTHSEETKQKMREAHKGKTHSDESREKMRKPKSKEHIQNIIKAKTGVKIGPLPKIKCPHCKREISVNNIKRFHLDNCNINI